MARVNHKIVRQRLNEKRSSITDRQFFSSRILAGYYEDIAMTQTRRYQYNRRVHVILEWLPESENIAATDNAEIFINAGHKMVTDVQGRENRYQVVTGLFGHELGHVLYTDFLAQQTYMNFIKNYKWYPEPPVFKRGIEIKNEQDFWEYLKADEKNYSVIMKVIHHIWNSLEDGYIENRMLNNFPGMLGAGLKTVRANHFKSMPTVTQMKEEEQEGKRHIIESILQMILCYAKFGEIKYGEEPLSDERIQIVFGLISEIDESVIDHSIKPRLKTTNLIIIRCWEYIKEFCEKIKEQSENGGSGESAEGLMSKILESMTGATSQAHGNSTPVGISKNEKDGSQTSTSRAKTQATKSDSQEEKKDEDNAEEGSTANDSKNEKAENESESESVEAEVEDNEKKNVEAEEGGRIPLTQTNSIYEPSEGTFEKNDDYEPELYETAGKEIESILETMAEKAACEELESERLKELNEVAQNISYGNIHSGVNIRVNRIKSVREGMVEQYNHISAPLLMISRQLQKSISKQLKDQRRGGKQTGLMMGRRLDAHALHRGDGKVFYKNNLPNQAPQLAVGLLLDESGSMSCANRATYARAAAIILYDFCQSLEIPVMVYGHSTGYGESVCLYSYAEFESYDNEDKYRLMDIGARRNNRDGAALRYVSERLSKRPEEVKILILVSDGQPADYGYSGTAAEEDLRGIKQEYQRKGVVFVAAAIGDDKANIERIYGDSFLDITDLNQLPTKLTQVVKRYIRV